MSFPSQSLLECQDFCIVNKLGYCDRFALRQTTYYQRALSNTSHANNIWHRIKLPTIVSSLVVWRLSLQRQLTTPVFRLTIFIFMRAYRVSVHRQTIFRL